MRSEMDKNPETHGMQDINYTFYHCMEITVELRRCKYSRATGRRWISSPDHHVSCVQCYSS